MIEYASQSAVLNATEKYIGKRTNIAPAIHELRERPDTLERIVWQFDDVIGSLNTWIKPDYPDHLIGNFERAAMPNVLKIRDSLGDFKFPYLTGVLSDSSRTGLKKGIKSLKEASTRMRRGEVEAPDGWQFHQDEMSAEDLTSALLIEIYGLYVRQMNPGFGEQGINPVIAFEEVLALTNPNTDLFIAVNKWYAQEEGFSEGLVRYVRRMDVSKLKRRRPYIENPVYEIAEISDSSASISDAAFKISLDPKAYSERMMEAKLQGIMAAIKSRSSRIFLVHWIGGKVPSGVWVGDKEIAWTQHGMVTDTKGERIGLYERVMENDGRHGDEQLIIVYLTEKPL